MMPIPDLRSENETLRERIAQLEHLLGMGDPVPSEASPMPVHLTRSEERLFGVLRRRNIVTKDIAMMALYSDRAEDSPIDKVVDVFICKLRRKLRPFNIFIQTKWNEGYFIDAVSKLRIDELCRKEKAA